MTNKERLEALREAMFKSAQEQYQGEGIAIYRNITIDLDDFMFLLREAEKANQ